MNTITNKYFRWLSTLIISVIFISTHPLLTLAGEFRPGTMALIQYNGDEHFGDPALNLRALTRHAEEAVRNGANIIVMPEGSTFGYAAPTTIWCLPGTAEYRGRTCMDVSAVAEEMPNGQTTAYWTEFSVKHGVYVLYSGIEKDAGKYYNSVGVVGPLGFEGKYRKRALYWVDSAYATSGQENFVLKTEFGNFGLLICMDASYDDPYYAPYKALDVNAIILAMDWDQNPNGNTAAKIWFRNRARNNGLDIYASDVSTWDGTAFYPASGAERQRTGMEEPAVGKEGVAYQPIAY